MKSSDNRPSFPKRAVVTAGMPYGNKELHFGHVGGVFVPADVSARFLRDRIGSENVIFVSGTDCYGSPIAENYRQLSEQGSFDGSIEDFVLSNHLKQKEALQAYNISLNFFGGSGIGKAAENHRAISEEIFNGLYKKGYLSKETSLQFFDSQLGVFLNGRQVVGRCPINGCNSEKAYADECSLGHQFSPRELINPISALSGTTPVLKEADNWYLKLEDFAPLLNEWADSLDQRENFRPFIVTNIKEYLQKPMIHIKSNELEKFNGIKQNLPQGFGLEVDEKKSSFTVSYTLLTDREKACDVLASHGIRFRTGKTIVPFRLTGNVEWGIPAPSVEGLDNQTFWVWPESLWAPISFTRTFLESTGSNENWRSFWCDKDSQVYQFIGEDNIYFYCVAEMALFMALNREEPSAFPKDGELQLPLIVANNHILFLNKKAGSSSQVKPPMALELLDNYTAEQLRSHFLGLGLGTRSVSFQPKALNPAADPKESDPVVKEGNLLANVFNRLVRSCFYLSQQHYSGKIPVGEPSSEILAEARETILEYERLMYLFEFNGLMNLLDTYIRNANKYWVKNIGEADKSNDTNRRTQTLVDGYHLIRVCAALLHPIAPEGTEMIRQYLRVNKDFWSWDKIFEPVYAFMENPNDHALEFLPPRTDFFKKHESQLV